MRKTALDTVYELATRNSNVFFVGSDLGAGTLNNFRHALPEQFLMEGISEANVVGLASGLALEGKVVYVNSIATFLTRRAYEQICLDLCLQNLSVRLIGNGGGMVYAPLGPTHMAIDDIAIMRAIPNMTILAPCDAEEMRRLILLTEEHAGPIYIRVAKGGDKIVSLPQENYQIGKAVLMHQGEGSVLVVTTGVMLQVALNAVDDLRAIGVEITVLHMHTIKPLDEAALKKYLVNSDVVVTIEEHTTLGGLGSAVAEYMMENYSSRLFSFKRLGLPDIFPDDYGSQDHLLSRFGLSVGNLVSTIRELIRTRDNH